MTEPQPRKHHVGPVNGLDDEQLRQLGGELYDKITGGFMHTPLRTFTNSKGRRFAVRVLPDGARYGLSNSLTTDSVQVEFYDTTYADDQPGHGHGFGPLGQFVSRYNVDTLYGHNGDLCLYGGEPDAWSIDGATMRNIRAWLGHLRDSGEVSE